MQQVVLGREGAIMDSLEEVLFLEQANTFLEIKKCMFLNFILEQYANFCEHFFSICD